MQEISYTGDGVLGAKTGDSSVAYELTAAGREERGNHPPPPTPLVLSSAKDCLTVTAPAAVSWG